MDKKILDSMIVFILDAYKNEIIRVLTNNDYEINTFKSYNFREIKNRGSYVELKFGF